MMGNVQTLFKTTAIKNSVLVGVFALDAGKAIRLQLECPTLFVTT